MSEQKKLPEYSSASYWEERYTSEFSPTGETSNGHPLKDAEKVQIDKTFEWLVSFSKSGAMRDALLKYLDININDCGTRRNLLHVGCGNSVLGVEIKNQFPNNVNVTNVDVSPTVITEMQKRYPQHIWEVADASKRPESNHKYIGSFDIVLDKGTMDLFCCGGTKKDKISAVKGYFEFCLEVMKTSETARWLGISFGIPESRLPLINAALNEIAVILSSAFQPVDGLVQACAAD